MAALPYMRFYVADYLADTGHLTTTQHGAYLLLIMNYWRRGKPLPDDDKYLASITRMPAREWSRNREVIADLFTVHDGHWHHIRIEKELEMSKDVRSSRSKAGVESARKKSNTCSTDVEDLFNNNRHHTSESDSEEPNGSSPIVPHPTWKPPEPQWSGWLAHREEIGKPVTPRSQAMAIKQLSKWFTEGRNIASILEYNVMQGWRGLFLPKESENGRSNQDIRSGNGNGSGKGSSLSRAIDAGLDHLGGT